MVGDTKTYETLLNEFRDYAQPMCEHLRLVNYHQDRDGEMVIVTHGLTNIEELHELSTHLLGDTYSLDDLCVNPDNLRLSIDAINEAFLEKIAKGFHKNYVGQYELDKKFDNPLVRIAFNRMPGLSKDFPIIKNPMLTRQADYPISFVHGHDGKGDDLNTIGLNVTYHNLDNKLGYIDIYGQYINSGNLTFFILHDSVKI